MSQPRGPLSEVDLGPSAEPPPASAPQTFARGSQPVPVMPDALEDLDVRGLIRPDPWPRKLLRRLVTVTLLTVLTALWWGVAPVAIPVMVVTDLVRRRPLLLVRFYLCIGFILFGQVWGLGLIFSIWLGSGFGLAWQRANRWMLGAEAYWADWNKRWMARIYDMSYVVEGSEVLRDGPTLMLTRHASINDTILPIALITTPHRVRLRIVLKAELLFAPIVDCMGHFIPTAFVKRASAAPERELEICRALAADLHPQETVMIFPEGTRFSPHKRASILAKLQTRDPAAAAAAEQLTHVLPLRLGGTHALIDAAPHADLVFCAHTGYEGSGQLEDFIRGGLYKMTVRVKFWRVPAAQVPRDHAERAAFLDAQWRKVNDFVATHQARRN